MKRSIKLSTAAVVILALGSAVTPAAANVAPASLGHSTWSSGAACFTPYDEAEINQCSTTQEYTIPIPVYAWGSYYITVDAQGATSANNVGCESIAINQDATVISRASGQPLYLSNFNSPQLLALYTTVPTGGTAYVHCIVNPGGRINTVQW